MVIYHAAKYKNPSGIPLSTTSLQKPLSKYHLEINRHIIFQNQSYIQLQYFIYSKIPCNTAYFYYHIYTIPFNPKTKPLYYPRTKQSLANCRRHCVRASLCHRVCGGRHSSQPAQAVRSKLDLYCFLDIQCHYVGPTDIILENSTLLVLSNCLTALDPFSDSLLVVIAQGSLTVTIFFNFLLCQIDFLHLLASMKQTTSNLNNPIAVSSCITAKWQVLSHWNFFTGPCVSKSKVCKY